MYKTAFRVIVREAVPWLGYVLLAWGLMYGIGAIERGPVLRYAIGLTANLPAIAGLAMPFVVFAGAMSWGDYSYSAGVRLGAPAVAVGATVGAMAFVLLRFAHPTLYSWYCEVAAECTSRGAGAEGLRLAISGRYAVVAALLAPVNVMLGVLIAWMTAHVSPLGRLRLERWGLAVLVWTAMYMLGDVLSRSGTAEILGPWPTQLIPVAVPGLVALVMLWGSRGRRYA